MDRGDNPLYHPVIVTPPAAPYPLLSRPYRDPDEPTSELYRLLPPRSRSELKEAPPA
jgi:hypothetical protein